MSKCPRCNSTEKKCLYQYPINPDDDKFLCLNYGYEYFRYDYLDKEKSGDK